MVYIFLADGFEDIEALSPVDMLRRSNIEVITVGIGSHIIKSSHGVPVITDILDSQIILDNKIDMIVLPGGMPGTKNLEKNKNVNKAIDFCIENNKYIAAICAAPSILGHKGLLNGKECTSFPEYRSELTGGIVEDKSVCVDKNIITSVGAGTCIQFGLKLVEILIGKENAEKLGEKIQWKTV